MNQVEQWFSILQRKRLQIADSPTKAALAERLQAFISEWNQVAHPFQWMTKSVAKVMAKCQRAEVPQGGVRPWPRDFDTPSLGVVLSQRHHVVLQFAGRVVANTGQEAHLVIDADERRILGGEGLVRSELGGHRDRPALIWRNVTFHCGDDASTATIEFPRSSFSANIEV